MLSMEKEKLVSDLLTYLSTEASCQETLACLNSKAEIGIRIAQSTEISVLYDGENVQALEKPALAPDFIFDASPEAIAILIAEKGLTPAQLGIKFLKLILSRDIKVRMPSSIFQVTRKGYLKIVSVGGMEFLSELKKHNLANIPKIIKALKGLAK